MFFSPVLFSMLFQSFCYVSTVHSDQKTTSMNCSKQILLYGLFSYSVTTYLHCTWEKLKAQYLLGMQKTAATASIAN